MSEEKRRDFFETTGKRLCLSLLFTAILLAGGAVMTGHGRAAWLAFAGFSAVLAAVVIRYRQSRRHRMACIAVFVLTLAALGRFSAAYFDTASESAALLDRYADEKHTFTAIVSRGDARPRDGMYMELCSVDDTPLRRRVTAYATNYSDRSLAEGDRLTFTGKLAKPVNREDAAFDFVSYLASRGVFLTVRSLTLTDTASGVRLLPGRFLRNYITDGIGAILEKYTTLDTYLRVRAVSTALMTGSKDGLPDEIYEDFRHSGLTHLLCVSGLHFSVVFGMLSFVISRLTRRSGLRLGILAGMALLYLVICDFTLSAVRSTIMTAAALADSRDARDFDGLYNLLLACVCILLIFPFSVLDMSLHLSFLATGGIVLISSSANRWLKRVSGSGTVVNAFLGLLAASIAANILTAPYLAAAYGSVSLYGVIATCVCIYPTELLLIILWAVVPFAPIIARIPPLCGLVASAITLLGSFAVRAAALFASLPGAVCDIPVQADAFIVWLAEAVVLAVVLVLRAGRMDRAVMVKHILLGQRVRANIERGEILGEVVKADRATRLRGEEAEDDGRDEYEKRLDDIEKRSYKR